MNLEDMTKGQLIAYILQLKDDNVKLNRKLAEASWKGEVDRQGGSFDWRDTFYDEWCNE